MSLAAKLPYDHAYAGGFPGIGSQPVPTDSNCLTYLAAVAAADGAGVEVGVATAVDEFFRAVKAVSLLDAVGSCCILAGARTITGALIPVAGVAPTANGGWASGDYSRAGGLTGDNVGLYLDSNYTPSQDDHHAAVYFKMNTSSSQRAFGVAASGGTPAFYLAGTTSPDRLRVRDFSTTDNAFVYTGLYEGFGGMSRTNSANFFSRVDSTTATHTAASLAIGEFDLQIFGENRGDVSRNYSDASISFYSTGEGLTETQMEALDTAVNNLLADMQFHFNTGLNPAGYDADTIAYINAGYANGGSLE